MNVDHDIATAVTARKVVPALLQRLHKCSAAIGYRPAFPYRGLDLFRILFGAFGLLPFRAREIKRVLMLLVHKARREFPSVLEKELLGCVAQLEFVVR